MADQGAIEAQPSSGSTKSTILFSLIACYRRSRDCQCCKQLSWARGKKFLVQQHLPLGLFVMVLFGFLVPQPGIALGQTPINIISICGIFFISGLQLQVADVKSALRAYASIAFGLVSILMLSPLLSLAVVVLPLEPKEFAQGLALFVAMPTTVSASVVMTAGANGNSALALLFSVSTNIIGVLTAPLFASYIFNGPSSSLDILALLRQLALTITLPLLAGVSLRIFPFVRAGVSRFKLPLKLVSSAFLISLPWIMMSVSSRKLHDVAAIDFFAVLGIATSIHGVLFAANFMGSRLVPHAYMRLPERKAVVICGAQKTINTAVSVILALPPGLGDQGLLVLPCIIFQFAQTIIDAFLVARWATATAPTPVPAADDDTCIVAGAPAASQDAEAAGVLPCVPCDTGAAREMTAMPRAVSKDAALAGQSDATVDLTAVVAPAQE